MNISKWKPSEIDFLIKNHSLMTYVDIAKKLNRTIKGTSKKARQLNLVKIRFQYCPCCFDCNEMKMDRHLDNFISHVEKIYNFQSRNIK